MAHVSLTATLRGEGGLCVVSVSRRLAQRVSHLPQGTGLEGVELRQCESGA